MPDRSDRSRDAVSKIFGDELAPKSIDDRENAASEDSAHDRWLRENTPPHHQ